VKAASRAACRPRASASSTARLITGAAAIIIVVFAGFATGQLVAFQEMV
jgi:hypothetical protein